MLEIARPRTIVVGSDSHSTSYGEVGVFGSGMGSTDIPLVWATGKTWLRVPETLRVDVSGRCVSQPDRAGDRFGNAGRAADWRSDGRCHQSDCATAGIGCYLPIPILPHNRQPNSMFRLDKLGIINVPIFDLVIFIPADKGHR